MNNDLDPNEKDLLLLDHEADGIKELDNLLPRWWVWLFYLTMSLPIGDNRGVQLFVGTTGD